MAQPADRSHQTFKHGSAWVRADFHLHTKADKEFAFPGNPDYFISEYVDALSQAGIKVGVITNHNKFDYDEFKTLRKTARKTDIFLIPGVEFTVNDGANGIHVLIAFSDEWIDNGEDYINSFLTAAFMGKTPAGYVNQNGRSNWNLEQTISRLETFQKDFFLAFAHVEDRSGLWKELEGGRLQELARSEPFRQRARALQKVRTHDVPKGPCRVKVKEWLGDAYPAEVEGSDCKSIDQIGKGKPCYIKIGDFTFEAVKYALVDFPHRVASEPQGHERSHILSVSFSGGALDGTTVSFSPELNTLIGIRGSGKSSIIEAVRYALDIPIDRALDEEYKKKLVEHGLGSGGKITLKAIDRRGQRYEIRRILKEKPDVYVDAKLQPGISIRETILHKPMYFGQKDLSNRGEGFENDLVDKLMGEKLVGVASRIDAQRERVVEAVRQFQELEEIDEKRKEYKEKKQDAEFRLEFYAEHGVEEKLQKQVDFDSDSRKCRQVVSFAKEFVTELGNFIDRYEDDLRNHAAYRSRQNEDFFDAFFETYGRLISGLERIRHVHADGNDALRDLQEKVDEFERIRAGLKEEFAGIERKLAEELKESGAQAIRPGEFRELRKELDHSKEMLKLLDKQESRREALSRELLEALTGLNDLWHEEFTQVREELEKVNASRSSLQITATFKGDKDSFVAFMKDVFRGSRIRETTFAALAAEFSDFGAMYKDLSKAKNMVGGQSQIFEQYFWDNLSTLLTWQVPNRFTIKYRGSELKNHSLGQRASALILFVLSQEENDVIIIDQPEDDLDNQTLYEDVIKLLRQLKPTTQFIFATHNANVPVLGDAEQIISCKYAKDRVYVRSGSIDCPEMQQEVVDIMEGGEEAFRQRKRIYEIWKPHDS